MPVPRINPEEMRAIKRVTPNGVRKKRYFVVH